MDIRMANIDFATLTSPVAEEEPCGPDLDLSGDPDYMNFVAKAENLLPSTFFSGPDGKPFDRSAIDFAAELTAMQPLLVRTRDIRLLVILAKLCILNRDLAGFERAVCAIQALLKQHWDAVHPREGGVFSARTAALETLDDLPHVIFPLQYTPFLHHGRIGHVAWRNYMIATGEVPARDGEGAHDLKAIETALMEGDLPELSAALGRFDALRTALAEIRSVCAEQAGFEQAPRLERLPALVDKVRSLLNDVVSRRDPAAAPETAPPIAGGEPGAEVTAADNLRSPAEVAGALAAAADYFARHEPSNPALLLVRQAEQLMGKSFIEVMQILVPRHVEEAAIYIGKEQPLQLPIGRLAELASPSVVSQGFTADDGSAPPRHFAAATRADAVRLLDQVGAYYRAVEPSSPLPHLTDRARDLAGRDFLSLLKHVLPAFNSDR
jgi:type VI secretion system protein ImpA